MAEADRDVAVGGVHGLDPAVARNAQSRAAGREAAWARRAARKNPKSPWNSLEVAKIFVGAMTPLLIAGIGGYATWQSHKQDTERVAREDMRARKAAAALLIDDLDNQFNEFNKIAADALDFYHAALKSGSPDIAAVHAQHSKISAAVDSYIRHFSSDWSRLSMLIENDDFAEHVARYASDGLEEHVLSLKNCSSNFEATIAAKSANRPDLDACDAVLNEGKDCALLIDVHLDFYEEPILADEREEARRVCKATPVSKRDGSGKELNPIDRNAILPPDQDH